MSYEKNLTACPKHPECMINALALEAFLLLATQKYDVDKAAIFSIYLLLAFCDPAKTEAPTRSFE